MRDVVKRLPSHNYTGAENDRGVLVDTDLAQAAIGAVERAKCTLANRTEALTGGAVQAATQRDALLHHLSTAHGVALPDMQQHTVERCIDDPALPETARELLSIRRQASTTSTAKYQALLHCTSPDGRLRGTLQFKGASRTGRWAGRLFQPHNLPRPTLSQEVIAVGIDAMKAGCVDLVCDDVMALTSSALRSCLIAPKNKKLVVADLSNIEGRVLAWLAGETPKLHAFRDFDTCQGVDGTWHSGEAITHGALRGAPITLQWNAEHEPIRKGDDIYKRAYAHSFGIAPQAVTKQQRQIGKVQELALGYGGGVGAFAAFAAMYHIDLEAMAEQAALPPLLLQQAMEALQWTKANHRPTFGLSDRAWLACDVFKRAWRNAHPAIAAFWQALQFAVTDAIHHPETTHTCCGITVQYSRAWLRLRLPSGRVLYYAAPRVDEHGALSYMGTHPVTRKWARLTTYGGKLVENITQAVSRDVLAACMPAIEAAGYSIVLTVHDEIITEADECPSFNAAHLAALMATPPPWAQGLPLAAEGFDTHRYRKQ
nr:DNA polymerase [Xylella fastidiosa]